VLNGRCQGFYCAATVTALFASTTPAPAPAPATAGTAAEPA